MENLTLGSFFVIEDENPTIEEESIYDNVIQESINGRVRKEGQSDISYMLESYLLIQKEEGKLFFYHNGSRKIRWSKVPFNSETEHSIIIDKKGQRWKCFYKFEKKKLF